MKLATTLTSRTTLTFLTNGKRGLVVRLLKSKKVIAALVGLVVALVSVGMDVELGAQTADAVTSVICQAVGCE